MTQYIVELQPKTWLAPWTGDPGRTLDINSARKFKKKSSAYRSLANALDKRDFNSPKVVLFEGGYKIYYRVNEKGSPLDDCKVLNLPLCRNVCSHDPCDHYVTGGEDTNGFYVICKANNGTS